jgi:MFS family permease
MLLADRAIQGAFGAMLAPAALSTLTVTFTNPAERGKAFGIYGAPPRYPSTPSWI